MKFFIFLRILILSFTRMFNRIFLYILESLSLKFTSHDNQTSRVSFIGSWDKWSPTGGFPIARLKEMINKHIYILQLLSYPSSINAHLSCFHNHSQHVLVQNTTTVILNGKLDDRV